MQIQGFYNGDLKNCEESFDKIGRTAQVGVLKVYMVEELNIVGFVFLFRDLCNF